MTVRRVQIENHPFPGVETGESQEWMRRGQWPAFWVMPTGRRETPLVVLYRLNFQVATPSVVRFHVSADERYVLWLDGDRVGRGPETGDPGRWFYDSYEANLAVGRHEFWARVSSLGSFAVFPQMSISHGFILAAEDGFGPLLNTGVADWSCARAGAWTFQPNAAGAAWSCEVITGGSCRPEDANRMGLAWEPVARELRGRSREESSYEWAGDHPLAPSGLPAPFHRDWTWGRVVHAEWQAGGRPERHSVAGGSDSRAGDPEPAFRAPTGVLDSSTAGGARARLWQACVDGTETLTVPANRTERVVLDLGSYVCGYPEFRVEGGAGSAVLLSLHEALFLPDGEGQARKANRDRVDGMVFRGAPDTFLPPGGPVTFETLGWRCGRYAEVVVRTGAEALTIRGMRLEETRYPLETESRFECNHPGPAAFIPVAVRCVQMCAHETHMDCPFYEQQMWVGDMRVQVLTSYCMTRDDRLARKCIRMAASSRRSGEATLCRWPVRQRMVIPSFSLWFVSMVYDYALWRGDLEFVRRLMPEVRATVEVLLQRPHASGLYLVPPGWNYVDWCAWPFGSPGIDVSRPTAVNNWQLVLVLRQLRDLETWLEEPELSARWGRVAGTLAERLDALCWDAGVGLYRDLPDEPRYSEHAQALAVLSGFMPEQRRSSIRSNLGHREDRVRASLYFQFYLFEMYRELGMADELWTALQPYFDMPACGYRTTPEVLVHPRSDCHAWSAHPYYHFFTTVLGIRPTAPGFGSCRVDPMPGPLEWARGALVHPRGTIEVDVRGSERRIHVPDGVRISTDLEEGR
jgi:hypothetical protein